MSAIADLFINGVMFLIDSIIAPFQFVFDTLEDMFSIFPTDIALALLTFGGFLIVLAIKRVIV